MFKEYLKFTVLDLTDSFSCLRRPAEAAIPVIMGAYKKKNFDLRAGVQLRLMNMVPQYMIPSLALRRTPQRQGIAHQTPVTEVTQMFGGGGGEGRREETAGHLQYIREVVREV